MTRGTILALVLLLAACGLKGDPEPPAGTVEDTEAAPTAGQAG